MTQETIYPVASGDMDEIENAIEAALWAGAELMGNISDDGYEAAVKAKVLFATYRAEYAALESELAAAKVENDLRGEFLGRVVDIREELINCNSNSWLDSIDLIRDVIIEQRKDLDAARGLLDKCNDDYAKLYDDSEVQP